jgi:hypothetical protein
MQRLVQPDRRLDAWAARRRVTPACPSAGAPDPGTPCPPARQRCHARLHQAWQRWCQAYSASRARWRGRRDDGAASPRSGSGRAPDRSGCGSGNGAWTMRESPSGRPLRQAGLGVRAGRAAGLDPVWCAAPRHAPPVIAGDAGIPRLPDRRRPMPHLQSLLHGSSSWRSSAGVIGDAAPIGHGNCSVVQGECRPGRAVRAARRPQANADIVNRDDKG